MTQADARNALPDIIAALSLGGVIDEMIVYAHEMEEALPLTDKLARFRAASDHRRLTQVREQVFN